MLRRSLSLVALCGCPALFNGGAGDTGDTGPDTGGVADTDTDADVDTDVDSDTDTDTDTGATGTPCVPSPEICDGIDNDCNGVVDDASTPWFEDRDGDGFGAGLPAYVVCGGPYGYLVDNADDCDDANALINPLAIEVCDNVDNDCSGVIDDGIPVGAACDGADSDSCFEGFLVCTAGVFTCSDVTGDSVEICNGVDDDCDGIVPADEQDLDADGFSVCAGDCNDAEPTMYPGAVKLCDGLDNNCDGTLGADEQDVDADGQMECEGDCNDADATIFLGAPELCDGIDNDCDGIIPADEVDTDGDGFTVCAGDCDDTNATMYPGAPKLCDGLDNNCDGSIGADELDADGDGQMECEGDCNDADATIYVGAVDIAGDGIDQDCDGVDNSGPPLVNGTLHIEVDFAWSRLAVMNFTTCVDPDPANCVGGWTGLNASDSNGIPTFIVSQDLIVNATTSVRFNTAEDLDSDTFDDNWVFWQDGFGGCLAPTSIVVATLDGADVLSSMTVFPFFTGGCDGGFSGLALFP